MRPRHFTVLTLCFALGCDPSVGPVEYERRTDELGERTPGWPDEDPHPEAELPFDPHLAQGEPDGGPPLPPPPPLPEEQSPAPDPIPSPAGTGEGCGDVDAIGACDGNILLWCDAGELHSLDCTAQGRACVLGLAEQGAVCETVPDDFGGNPGGQQMCEGVPALGTCDGDILIRCVDGNPIETDCAANGQRCGITDVGGVCYADSEGPALQAVASQARGGCDQTPAPASLLALLALIGLRRRR